MATARNGRVDRARNGEYFTSLLTGQSGGNQGATFRCGLDNQHTSRQARDNPVPAREIGGHCGRSQRELGDDRALVGNGESQFLVAGRVESVGTGSDDRDRLSIGGEGAAMCRRIDAKCQSADDGQAFARQCAGKAFSCLHALWRGIAAADHGQSRFGE